MSGTFLQKYIVPAVLALATVFIINTYVFPPESGSNLQPGDGYTLPVDADLNRVANREVTFREDEKISAEEQLTTVQTNKYEAVFSTFGGTLCDISFKHHEGKNGSDLKTVYHKTFHEREESMLTVMLDSETPYFYTLIKKEKDDTHTVLVYSAENRDWEVTKTFYLSDENYQIDMGLKIRPKTAGVSVRPRIFLSSPFIGELQKQVVSGVRFDQKSNDIKRVADRDLNEKAWVLPEIFGTENNYFMHGLVGNSDGFIQRGFYKKQVADRVTTILEGKEVTETSEARLAFYIGPKSLDSLRMVDSRLEGLLSFGWLSFIAKFLLMILLLIQEQVHNFGLAIILLTILIKLVMLPLSVKSQRLMGTMEKHQPQIAYLRKKYAHDQMRLNAELMKYYQEHKTSPFAPVFGCLGQLIQLPIFFSLYRVLSSSIDLYNAPFMLWLQDLSSPDPYYILPLCVGLAIMFQPNRVGGKKQAAQAAMMPYIFGAIMTAVFAGLPAGLGLYMSVNMLFSMLEIRVAKRA